jgi:hypothetical protein
VEEGVEVLVTRLRRYGAFRLAFLVRGYKQRRIEGAWLRWQAMLRRQVVQGGQGTDAAAVPPQAPVEVDEPPWAGKGLGSEAEEALQRVHTRLQDVVTRLRALGEEVEGEVRQRQLLLQEIDEQGEDPEARLRVLLLDVDEEGEDGDDSSSAAAFRRAVVALLARAKALAQKMVKDMFRELEHEHSAEQLLLMAATANDDHASAPGTPGDRTPLLFSPRAGAASSSITPPPCLVGTDHHILPCVPPAAHHPPQLNPLPRLSSPCAADFPQQHPPVKAPPLPSITAADASPPPASPASVALRQRQEEEEKARREVAERCAREEGLIEAVRQRLATQGDCVEELEHRLKDQKTKVKLHQPSHAFLHRHMICVLRLCQVYNVLTRCLSLSYWCSFTL